MMISELRELLATLKEYNIEEFHSGDVKIFCSSNRNVVASKQPNKLEEKLSRLGSLPTTSPYVQPEKKYMDDIMSPIDKADLEVLGLAGVIPLQKE